jgi:hypothetical protein
MVWAGKDRRFSIDGGRAGWLTFVDGGQRARLEWEMLVGEVAMVIYGERSFWKAPDERAMTRDELRTLITQLASALGAPVELAFTDGSEVIRQDRDAPEC